MKQLQHEYLQVTFCICDFLTGLDMQGFACWCMVLLLLVACICRVMIVDFSLALPSSRCHGVGMFILAFEHWFPDGFRNPGQRWSQVPFPKA